jgi:excisionase family DNA binding protein
MSDEHARARMRLTECADLQPDPTIRETAAALRVAAPTIYKMLAQGQLDSYTIGRSRRITRESLLRKMKRVK